VEYSALDWNEILKNIQGFATSGSARMSIGSLQPLGSADAAKLSVNEVFDGVELVQTGTRPFMESLDLYEPWFTRVKKNAVLKTLEIKDVRSFCLEVLALREVAQTVQNSFCQNLVENLMEASEPLSAIDQILTPRGDIRSDASETLYKLFREKENLTRQIESTLDKTVHAHDMQSMLQDKYVTTREGRWVLPIRSGMQHYVPGVIHGSSQTKQTVYMEPEQIIPMNNRLRQVEVEIEDEIERLLTELSNYLHSLASAFAATRDLLEKADTVLAKAQWSLRISAQDFSFSDGKMFLNEVRHPLLVLAGRNVVSNSVQLTPEKSILLLSGPNAGGKTVLLKAIGLAAQMSRCGLPICAGENSELPFFREIQIGIGDSQSVGAELSTFAAHLKVLENAAKLSGPSNLILVDEICGSTDPEEGSALARAFIESFSHHDVFGVITSHLGPLKAGWRPEDRVLNGSLEYDSKTGRPTYQYLQGVPGDSLAIQTAKRVGVPREIIDRSMELLSPETRTRLSGIEELDQLKSDINVLREHLKKEQQRARFEKEKYESMSQKIQKEKEDLLAKTVRQAEKKIEELIQQAKVDQTFKRHTALQEIKQTLPEIVKSRPGTQASSGAESAEDFGKKYPPGTKVFVPSLNQDGLIQSTPNSKGEVMILSNSIRLSLPWSELKPPQRAQNPTAGLVRRSVGGGGSPVTVALVDAEKTVDLRGQTVEEAISNLEIELDNSATRKEDRIKIIHGHGTETLKKAVRTYLSRSVYVKKWKAGSAEQGGDGITWAELSDD
jgi:DNA mismatch repair protein MutS2